LKSIELLLVEQYLRQFLYMINLTVTYCKTGPSRVRQTTQWIGLKLWQFSCFSQDRLCTKFGWDAASGSSSVKSAGKFLFACFKCNK